MICDPKQMHGNSHNWEVSMSSALPTEYVGLYLAKCQEGRNSGHASVGVLTIVIF